METPSVIIDVPLPILGTQTPNDNTLATLGHSSSLESGAGIRPTTIPDASISSAPTAKEVISSALDTSIRKILGAFSFGKVGALEVGQYQAGVSGDVRITPTGIIGRDTTGLTRFSLDTNGDLILSDSTGETVIDPFGVVSVSNFVSSFASSALSLNQAITSSGGTDITGATFTFTLPRATIIAFETNVTGFMNGAFNYRGDGIVDLYVDGVRKNRIVQSGGWGDDGLGGVDTFGVGNSTLLTSAEHYVAQFAAGTHTVKLVGILNTGSGSPTYYIYHYRFSYFMLGR